MDFFKSEALKMNKIKSINSIFISSFLKNETVTSVLIDRMLPLDKRRLRAVFMYANNKWGNFDVATNSWNGMVEKVGKVE